MIHAVAIYPGNVDGPGGYSWRAQPHAVHVADGRRRAQRLDGRRWLVAARSVDELLELVTEGARLVTVELARYEGEASSWAVVSGGTEPAELERGEVVELRRQGAAKSLIRKTRAETKLPSRVPDFAGTNEVSR